MAAITWKQAVSGNWTTAADWSTGTVPTIADDVTIGLVGNYIVNVTSFDNANSLIFDAPGAQLLETGAGALNIAGALTVNNGFVSLDGGNTIGSVALNGGEIALGVAGAFGNTLGSGTVTTTGGELLATADQIIVNALDLGGDLTIAAAHGTTLDIGSGGWTLESGATLNFGAVGQDGTVVWHSVFTGILSPFNQIVHVGGGTLQAAANEFGLSFLLGTVAATEVDAGATIDLAGYDTSVDALRGAGTITNSGNFALLTLQGAFSILSGTISGNLSVDVKNSIVLTGSSTYTGATTIESGAALTLGNGGTSGSIPAGSSASITINGTLAFDRSNAVTIAATLFGNGTITQEGTGTTTLTGTNSFGGTLGIFAGTLAAGANALGAASATLTGGELLATADETLSGPLTVAAGSAIVAAAHGKTFDVGSGGWSLSAGAMQFGAAGQDGTVAFHSPVGNIGSVNGTVEVAAGTLKAGDANLGLLLGNAASTTVDSGASIDVAGFDTTIKSLSGAGTIANSAGLAILTLDGASIAGSVTGTISLEAAGTGSVTLTGANTYTGNTIIDSSSTLAIGNGGASGSIAASSAIVDSGTLAIVRSGAVTLANSISGAGSLSQAGSGTTTINTANTYAGGTTIQDGTLAIGNAGALGSGTITFMGGELLGTVDETIANRIAVAGLTTATIAAAHGATLDAGSGGWDLGSGSTFTFGATGKDGTVVWHSVDGTITNAGVGDAVEVQAGTLKAGDNSLGSFLLLNVAQTTVDPGATLDLAGFNAVVPNLQGSGTVVSSAPSVVLTLSGANFGGTLAGPTIHVTSDSTLSGQSFFTSNSPTIDNGVTLTNGGIFDLAGAAGVIGGAVDNTATFEKTAGTGASFVSAAFTNAGEVDVTSGSIAFTGGFTNIGIVKGVLSHSGSTWTVTANAPGQSTWFGGSGDNHFVVTAAPTFIDGGSGNDTVELRANMTFGVGSLLNVETVHVDSGVSANLSALANGENIVLSSVTGGSAAVIGTQGADHITGGAGNDMLNGGGGGDTMLGGPGDDLYYVDSASDHVIELANGGTDRVLTSVSYALAGGQSIEALTPTDYASTSNINLTGNTLHQAIFGNAGDNSLNDGGAGAPDTLEGLGGNDLYYVHNASDTIIEAAGDGTDRVLTTVSFTLRGGQSIEALTPTDYATTDNISLTGNELAQTIYGNAGNNVINGAGGNDNLEGFGGSDTFVFNSALSASGNFDHILDFTHGSDKIELDHAIFTALAAANPLPAADFTTGAPANPNQHILYNTTTGVLSYDDDGNGAHAAVQFAVLSGHPALTSTDLFVV